jgi:hypothetical protein
MNCPGSVALIGDESSTTNQAAMLGTAAHKLIEVMIIAGDHEARDYLGSTFLVYGGDDDGEDHETEYYPPGAPALDPENARPGWFMFVADEKMVEGVQQTIDEVDRIRGERCEGTQVLSEVYLDGSWLDSRLGGTLDVPIIEPFGWLDVVDHKNGYILVEAKDNDQLKQYAMLAAHEYPEAEGVTVTISQPNSPHKDGLIRSESFSIDELKLYEIRVKEAAEATSKPNAPRRAGDWCLWCPAKTRCPEFDEMMLEEAKADFSEDEPPAILPLPKSTEELAHKMTWVPVIEAWVANIKADIQRELENGNEVSGWKLVRGRAKRRWLSTTAVQTKMTGVDIGIDDADLWIEPKLKSPAQMEKLGVGRPQRKLVKLAVSELAFMPNGALTIAPITDPREVASALDDAQNEFAADDDDDDDFG